MGQNDEQAAVPLAAATPPWSDFIMQLDKLMGENFERKAQGLLAHGLQRPTVGIFDLSCVMQSSPAHCVAPLNFAREIEVILGGFICPHDFTREKADKPELVGNRVQQRLPRAETMFTGKRHGFLKSRARTRRARTEAPRSAVSRNTPSRAISGADSGMNGLLKIRGFRFATPDCKIVIEYAYADSQNQDSKLEAQAPNCEQCE